MEQKLILWIIITTPRCTLQQKQGVKAPHTFYLNMGQIRIQLATERANWYQGPQMRSQLSRVTDTPDSVTDRQCRIRRRNQKYKVGQVPHGSAMMLTMN